MKSKHRPTPTWMPEPAQADVNDDGVGENAKLNTGSGSIHATGLHGGIQVETGSGDIYAEQTGRVT